MAWTYTGSDLKLSDRVTTDYGVALLQNGERSATDMLADLNKGDGQPVLAMAEGPVGVLRAMEVRSGPMTLEGMNTLAVVNRIDGVLVLNWWILNAMKGGS